MRADRDCADPYRHSTEELATPDLDHDDVPSPRAASLGQRPVPCCFAFENTLALEDEGE